MLRSFDYAPRVAAMTATATGDDGSEQRAYRAAEWSARNQAAFLEAYAGREPTGDEQTLLAAYVADKAVYECVYEARNRPTWLSIPMAAFGTGHDTGGQNTGGQNTGGQNTGGQNTGGQNTGGQNTGGQSTRGHDTREQR